MAKEKEKIPVNVAALCSVIEQAGENKLVVALAYYLGMSTTTIYKWRQIKKDSAALAKLTYIGNLRVRDGDPDGVLMGKLIKEAQVAVAAAMKG